MFLQSQCVASRPNAGASHAHHSHRQSQSCDGGGQGCGWRSPCSGPRGHGLCTEQLASSSGGQCSVRGCVRQLQNSNKTRPVTRRSSRYVRIQVQMPDRVSRVDLTLERQRDSVETFLPRAGFGVNADRVRAGVHRSPVRTFETERNLCDSKTEHLDTRAANAQPSHRGLQWFARSVEAVQQELVAGDLRCHPVRMRIDRVKTRRARQQGFGERTGHTGSLRRAPPIDDLETDRFCSVTCHDVRLRTSVSASAFSV